MVRSATLPSFFAAAAIVVAGCRGTNPQDPDSDLDQAAEQQWYGPDGSAAACDPPAAACPSFNDDKAFIDLCVEKGFQARTCGCSLRCSGKLDYQGAAAADGAAPQPGGSCRSELAEAAAAILKARRPGASLDRCLDSHVCHGVLGTCEGDDLRASSRLRELASAGCEAEILPGLCRDGFVDSLACPAPEIAMLSRIWSEFRGKEGAVKRCVRKFICSDDRSACAAEHLAQVQAVKAAVDRDGCEYWLRQFCSLGGSAW